MNNKPVAWIKQNPETLEAELHFDKPAKYWATVVSNPDIPLYIHPVSQYKAITNTKIEPTVVSYTHPVKELTDEEIEECCCFLDVRLHHRYEPNAVVKDIEWTVTGIKDFVEAVLRKAREK